MDTSETYIKMADCEEIQEYRTTVGLKYGDYYHRKDMFPQHVDIFPDSGWALNGQIVYGFIWLPRQDQLQAMVGGKFDTWSYMAKCFSDFATSDGWRSVPPDFRVIETVYNSMEQLWMAFAMKEKHGKQWSGTEWVKG